MISAQAVKELRELTGAGMMICKEALQETDGQLEEAKTYLRVKMGNKLSEKDASTSKEGVVALSINRQKGSIAKLCCQTDFVAKNEEFIQTAKEIVNDLASNPNFSLSDTESKISDLYTKMKEVISLSDFRTVKAKDNEIISGYVHSNNKIGALVVLSCKDFKEENLEEIVKIGNILGMQIVASKPKYIRGEDVPSSVTLKEAEIYTTQLLNEGKPEASISKILLGKMNKFISEICLLKQPFVKDPKQTVEQFLQSTGFKLDVEDFHIMAI